MIIFLLNRKKKLINWISSFRGVFMCRWETSRASVKFVSCYHLTECLEMQSPRAVLNYILFISRLAYTLWHNFIIICSAYTFDTRYLWINFGKFSYMRICRQWVLMQQEIERKSVIYIMYTYMNKWFLLLI